MTTWIFFAQTWLCFIMSDITRSVFFFFFLMVNCAVTWRILCINGVALCLLHFHNIWFLLWRGHIMGIWCKRIFWLSSRQYTKPGLSIIVISKVCNEISNLGFGIWLCYFTSKTPVYFQLPFLMLWGIFISVLSLMLFIY